MGVDIAGEVGDPIVAAADGKVIAVCPASKCRVSGNQVNIKHPDGTVTRYFHLNSVTVSEGDFVTAETVIGTLGITGNAANTTQPHLHFEVREGGILGVAIDPEKWLESIDGCEIS
ncbi:MAG: M23 family metallopeptidase [Gammaproteobacteria bacterium]|nr:MAG: M23 family metallopeptidase [Gammaproteobacteria bacterium]